LAAEAAKSRLIQVLAQIYPPWADETDRAILDSAAAAWKRGEAADLCDRKLAEISAQHGVDFAVALLYMAIRRYELHGPMIQSIEREAAADAVDPPTIVIVPGAFYKHHDHTGADGSRLILAAQKLG